MQQVHVKFGIQCDRATLKNGTIISSLLDIPAKNRAIYLIAEDFSRAEAEARYANESSQADFGQIQSVRDTPFERGRMSQITDQKRQYQRPKQTSVHIHSLPPLDIGTSSQKAPSQQNQSNHSQRKRNYSSRESNDTIRHVLFPESGDNSGKGGLYSLSPQVRKQIKEALMKRFPVANFKIQLQNNYPSSDLQNLEVKNIDPRFPTPTPAGAKQHQVHALKSGVKQSTNYRRVVQMMATRVQLKSRADSPSQKKIPRFNQESIQDILKRTTPVQLKYTDTANKMIPLQSAHKLQNQTIQNPEKMGLKVRCLTPQKNIYIDNSSLSSLETITGERVQKPMIQIKIQPQSEKIQKEKPSISPQQAAVLLNGSNNQHYQYAVMEAIKRQESKPLAVNQMKTFSFDIAAQTKSIISTHLIARAQEKLKAPTKRQAILHESSYESIGSKQAGPPPGTSLPKTLNTEKSMKINALSKALRTNQDFTPYSELPLLKPQPIRKAVAQTQMNFFKRRHKQSSLLEVTGQSRQIVDTRAQLSQRVLLVTQESKGNNSLLSRDEQAYNLRKYSGRHHHVRSNPESSERKGRQGRYLTPQKVISPSWRVER